MDIKRKRSLEIWTMIISFIVLVFTMLGVCLHIGFVHKIDLAAFNWFDRMFEEPAMNYNGGWFNDIMTIVASYGDVLTFVLLSIAGAIILIVKRYYLLSLWILATVGFGGILGVILKAVFHRSRPYDHLLVDTGFSFPSGHSLSSTLIAMILLSVVMPKFSNKALRYTAYVMIAVLWGSILFSRLYFHAHFLTDVLGGTALGILWVLGMKYIGHLITPFLQKLPLLKKSKIYTLCTK